MSSNENVSFSEWITEPQSLIALSAVLLSVCGLFISIYETSLIRQEQYASVWPHVTVGPSIDTDSSIKILVQNTGVGPAKIKAAAVTHDGEVKKSWTDLIQSLGVKRLKDFSVSVINGGVLPPNSREESILTVMADTTEVEIAKINKLQQKLLEGEFDVTLCYCSVYEQCWTTSMQDVVKRFRGENVPSISDRKVESCTEMKVSGI